MQNPRRGKPLHFGTSGLRDTVENMTDMECYINTLGFIRFLGERGEIDSMNREIALAGDLRSSTPRIMSAVGQAVCDSSRIDPGNLASTACRSSLGSYPADTCLPAKI